MLSIGKEGVEPSLLILMVGCWGWHMAHKNITQAIFNALRGTISDHQLTQIIPKMATKRLYVIE